MKTPWLHSVLALGALLLGAGCGSAPPPPSPAAAKSAAVREGDGLPDRPTPFSAATNTPPPAERPKQTLAEARKGFVSRLVASEAPKEAAPKPPAAVFKKVTYQSPAGKLAAYVSPDPRDEKKHPAIIWIHGGDSNSIGDVWTKEERGNDQTAAAYREAGIVMMYPSLRGGNDNPGTKEGFLGEVDDVLAAAEFLASQTYVDPERIYLGGHSTGGTLVLLVAAVSPRFRAVFSIGPIHDVRRYGPEYKPFQHSDKRETELRSPVYWLHGIESPVFIVEGAKGNAGALESLAAVKNANVRCLLIGGMNHFDVLAPVNELLAKKILADTEAKTNLTLTAQDIGGLR